MNIKCPCCGEYLFVFKSNDNMIMDGVTDNSTYPNKVATNTYTVTFKCNNCPQEIMITYLKDE